MKQKNTVLVLVAGAMVLAVLVITGLLTRPDPGGAAGPVQESENEVAGFYRGRSITLLVPSDPGGGFDEYCRLLAPYLEKYTGARVDVLNMPGAGGMRAVNELHNSPRNGLTLAIMNGSAMVTNRMAGVKGAEYDIQAFDFLGRVVADTRILAVAARAPYTGFADIRNAEETVKLGATGLGGTAYVDGVITKEAFGLNVQIVHGFDSSSVVRQAMLRGNIAGLWGSWGSARDAVESGQERVLLQSGRQRIPDLPDVPTVFEFIDSTPNPERTRAILSAWNALNSVGRPLAATPGTPPGRLRYLRRAFDQAMNDPELLRRAGQAERPLHYASGEEMTGIVREATSMPPGIEQLFIRAIRGEL